MAFKMAHGSLFSVLLRSPWWYSTGIALVLMAISLLIANGQFFIFGLAAAFPFLGIAGYTGFRQSQRPPKKRIAEVASMARNRPPRELTQKIAAIYEKERFDAEPFKGKVADTLLTRGARNILLCTKRFKAATTGIEPLKQLVADGERAEATGYLYVALGEVSKQARDFANQNDIEIIQAEALTTLLEGKAEI